MLLNEIIPHPSLAEYVRLYRLIHFVFPASMKIPPKAYTPRPEHCLQFFPVGANVITNEDNSKTVTTKHAILSGQHLVLNHRQVVNNFLSVQVVFQPGALHRWLGIPAVKLTNVLTDAEDLLGNKVAAVNEKLFHAKNYTEMIAVVELFLQEEFKKIKKDNHPINNICYLMLKEEDRPLDWFVKQAFLSHRQFDRKFYDSTGVSPKDFLKVIKFDRAFRMKNRYPDKDWLTIALHCGYYDYPHLSKVYQLFTGHTPPEFFKIDNQAPERLLGEAET